MFISSRICVLKQSLVHRSRTNTIDTWVCPGLINSLSIWFRRKFKHSEIVILHIKCIRTWWADRMHFYLTEVKDDISPWHADHHKTASVLVVTSELGETARGEDPIVIFADLSSIGCWIVWIKASQHFHVEIPKAVTYVMKQIRYRYIQINIWFLNYFHPSTN